MLAGGVLDLPKLMEKLVRRNKEDGGIQYNTIKKKEVESDLWLPQYNEVYPVNEYFWKNEKRRIMHDWHADTQLMPRRVCEGVTDCSVSCHLLR